MSRMNQLESDRPLYTTPLYYWLLSANQYVSIVIGSLDFRQIPNTLYDDDGFS